MLCTRPTTQPCAPGLPPNHVHQAYHPTMCARPTSQPWTPGLPPNHVHQAYHPTMCTRPTTQPCAPGLPPNHVCQADHPTMDTRPTTQPCALKCGIFKQNIFCWYYQVLRPMKSDPIPKYQKLKSDPQNVVQ